MVVLMRRFITLRLDERIRIFSKFSRVINPTNVRLGHGSSKVHLLADDVEVGLDLVACNSMINAFAKLGLYPKPSWLLKI